MIYSAKELNDITAAATINQAETVLKDHVMPLLKEAADEGFDGVHLDFWWPYSVHIVGRLLELGFTVTCPVNEDPCTGKLEVADNGNPLYFIDWEYPRVV